MSMRPTTVSSAIVGEWDNPTYNSMSMFGGGNARASSNQNQNSSTSLAGSVNFRRQAENVLNMSAINAASGASGRYGINSGMNTPNLHGGVIIESVIPGSPARESVTSAVLLSSRDNRDRDGLRDPLLSSRDRRDVYGSQPSNFISETATAYHPTNVPYTIFDELNTARSSTTIRSGAPFIYAQIDENSDVETNYYVSSDLNASISADNGSQPSKYTSEDNSTTTLLTGRSNDTAMRGNIDRQNNGRMATVSMPPIANNSKLRVQLQQGRGNSSSSASTTSVNSISRKKRKERSLLHLNFDNDTSTGLSDTELFDGDSHDLNSSFGTQSTEPHRRNSGKKSDVAYQSQPAKHISPKNVSIPLVRTYY